MAVTTLGQPLHHDAFGKQENHCQKGCFCSYKRKYIRLYCRPRMLGDQQDASTETQISHDASEISQVWHQSICHFDQPTLVPAIMHQAAKVWMDCFQNIASARTHLLEFRNDKTEGRKFHYYGREENDPWQKIIMPVSITVCGWTRP